MAILDARKTKPLEGGASFSLSNRISRALWQVSWAVLAAWTPPPLFAWRTTLLRLFGAEIAPSARVYGKTRVWYPPNLTMAGKRAARPRRELLQSGADFDRCEGGRLAGRASLRRNPRYQRS